MQSVRQGPDNVRVRYRDTRSGEQQFEEMADCCVCCPPMAVLQRLNINLSSEMKEGVRTTEHSTAAKMGLQMRRRTLLGGGRWDSWRAPLVPEPAAR